MNDIVQDAQDMRETGPRGGLPKGLATREAGGILEDADYRGP